MHSGIYQILMKPQNDKQEVDRMVQITLGDWGWQCSSRCLNPDFSKDQERTHLLPVAVAEESNLALCKSEEATMHFILNFKHLFRLSSAAWCLSLNKHLWLILCRVSVLFGSRWTIVHCHGNCFETPRQLYQMIRCTKFIYLFIAWKPKVIHKFHDP